MLPSRALESNRGFLRARQGGLRFSRRLARIRTSDPWVDFFATRNPMVYFGGPVLGFRSFATAASIYPLLSPKQAAAE